MYLGVPWCPEARLSATIIINTTAIKIMLDGSLLLSDNNISLNEKRKNDMKESMANILSRRDDREGCYAVIGQTWRDYDFKHDSGKVDRFKLELNETFDARRFIIEHSELIDVGPDKRQLFIITVWSKIKGADTDPVFDHYDCIIDYDLVPQCYKVYEEKVFATCDEADKYFEWNRAWMLKREEESLYRLLPNGQVELI